MEKEEIRYAIKLTDGGYVDFYQRYEGADAEVLSTTNVSDAVYWKEDEIEEAFKELIENNNEEYDYIFDKNVSPLKIVRVIFRVEEEWK